MTTWTMEEPCPACGSMDIAECDIHVRPDQIRVGWECRDCGRSLA